MNSRGRIEPAVECLSSPLESRLFGLPASPDRNSVAHELAMTK
jgi:hypothetical protein